MKTLRLLFITILAGLGVLLLASDADPDAMCKFLFSKIGSFVLIGLAAIVCLFYDKRGMLDEETDHPWQ